MENIFGDYLKELRLKREYSINQLALKSDVSGFCLMGNSE